MMWTSPELVELWTTRPQEAQRLGLAIQQAWWRATLEQAELATRLAREGTSYWLRFLERSDEEA